MQEVLHRNAVNHQVQRQYQALWQHGFARLHQCRNQLGLVVSGVGSDKVHVQDSTHHALVAWLTLPGDCVHICSEVNDLAVILLVWRRETCATGRRLGAGQLLPLLQVNVASNSIVVDALSFEQISALQTSCAVRWKYLHPIRRRSIRN